MHACIHKYACVYVWKHTKWWSWWWQWHAWKRSRIFRRKLHAPLMIVVEAATQARSHTVCDEGSYVCRYGCSAVRKLCWLVSRPSPDITCKLFAPSINFDALSLTSCCLWDTFVKEYPNDVRAHVPFQMMPGCCKRYWELSHTCLYANMMPLYNSVRALMHGEIWRWTSNSSMILPANILHVTI